MESALATITPNEGDQMVWVTWEDNHILVKWMERDPFAGVSKWKPKIVRLVAQAAAKYGQTEVHIKWGPSNRV